MHEYSIVQALLERVEAKKFVRVKKPRAARASRSRWYVPRAARRQAVSRDGARCSFVADDGKRCEETGFLELDHVVPVARGGDASDGVRILCRSHNHYEASGSSGERQSRPARRRTRMDDGHGGALRGAPS